MPPKKSPERSLERSVKVVALVDIDLLKAAAAADPTRPPPTITTSNVSFEEVVENNFEALTGPARLRLPLANLNRIGIPYSELLVLSL